MHCRGLSSGHIEIAAHIGIHCGVDRFQEGFYGARTACRLVDRLISEQSLIERGGLRIHTSEFVQAPFAQSLSRSLSQRRWTASWFEPEPRAPGRAVS